MLQTNLNHLVSQLESRFNTKIYEFGIAEVGSRQFNELVPIRLEDSQFIGYMVIPVDEDVEYIITKNQRSNYAMFDPIDMFEARQNITSLDSVKDFIQKAFQGRVYSVKTIKCSNLPNSPNSLENIQEFEDSKYLYLVYAIG